MDTSALLAQVRRLQIVANRHVDDLLAGEYLSVFKGRGMEFDEVREYVPGDDVRSIDWNVTARTNIPHVKRFAEERELTILFAVDVSRSGIAGSADRSKIELATELAAVLMFSALKNNDKVGLVLFAGSVISYAPPRKGKGNVLRLIRELVAITPAPGGTDVGGVLEFVQRVCRRRAIVFLLSDLPPGDYERQLSMANRRHDVVAITIDDPLDRAIATARGAPVPGLGLTRIVDAETGAIMVRDLGDPALQRAYAARAAARREARRSLLARTGVDELAVSTHESYMSAIHRFFRARERRLAQHA